VETNIIIFELKPGLSAPGLVERLKENNILAYAITPRRVRLVLHLDISREMVDKTVDIFSSL
jgi:threonine aldolase